MSDARPRFPRALPAGRLIAGFLVAGAVVAGTLAVTAPGAAAAPSGAAAGRDPVEPAVMPGGPGVPGTPGIPGSFTAAKTLPPGPPAGALARAGVDESALRAIIEELAACGTRHSLSSWTDAHRGIGCGRDRIVARFQAIARAGGNRLQVLVDPFEATNARTGDKPAHFENVLAFLPGTDPALAKTVFLVSGHFDSMPSSVMDPATDAPGADDDASGVAVALESARLLAGGPEATHHYRATLLFAAVSGEEQGLIGSTHLREYLEAHGYTVGGYLDNDIVGADFTPGSPHRVRVFSGGGADGVDSPSRDLARAVEEIAGVDAIRLVFRLDRLGRGGDHRPFVEAGLPAVRFTEPLENYAHEHQTPRVEEGREFGDLVKFLNFRFLGDVARANAEVLRQLALAPAPPTAVQVAGGVTPDTHLSWNAEADAGRAGFEVLWRETTDPRWSVYTSAAAAGETVLAGVSTDNHFFAVRAVGTSGARSRPVAAVLKPPPPKK
jgi:hypothetical protein